MEQQENPYGKPPPGETYNWKSEIFKSKSMADDRLDALENRKCKVSEMIIEGSSRFIVRYIDPDKPYIPIDDLDNVTGFLANKGRGGYGGGFDI